MSSTATDPSAFSCNLSQFSWVSRGNLEAFTLARRGRPRDREQVDHFFCEGRDGHQSWRRRKSCRPRLASVLSSEVEKWSSADRGNHLVGYVVCDDHHASPLGYSGSHVEHPPDHTEGVVFPEPCLPQRVLVILIQYEFSRLDETSFGGLSDELRERAFVHTFWRPLKRAPGKA